MHRSLTERVVPVLVPQNVKGDLLRPTSASSAHRSRTTFHCGICWLGKPSQLSKTHIRRATGRALSRRVRGLESVSENEGQESHPSESRCAGSRRTWSHATPLLSTHRPAHRAPGYGSYPRHPAHILLAHQGRSRWTTISVRCWRAHTWCAAGRARWDTRTAGLDRAGLSTDWSLHTRGAFPRQDQLDGILPRY